MVQINLANDGTHDGYSNGYWLVTNLLSHDVPMMMSHDGYRTLVVLCL